MSTTSITRRPIRGAGLVLAALASLALPCQAQQTEGYDALRQITAQIMKANLLILQDVTGSMAYYPDWGPPPGKQCPQDYFQCPSKTDDSRGQLFWNDTGGGWAYNVFQGKTFGAVTVPSVWSAGVNGSSTPTGSCSSNCRFWYYLLTYEGPSRLATVKNALGSSIDLVTAYTPPLVQSQLTNAKWQSPVSPATVTIAPVPPDLTKTLTGYIQAWLFTYDYGKDANGKNIGKADPGQPIAGNVLYDANNFPLLTSYACGLKTCWTCSVGTCTYLAPQDIVGNPTNLNKVNWGLTAFSSNSPYPKTLVQIDTTDANVNLATLEDYLYFSGSTRPGGTQPGLAAGGGTNTIAGFGTATTEITRAANADPKIVPLRCNRPYGVILVTDGMSNTGNPSGDNWINPCGAGPTACDQGPQDDCPSNWAKYAAQQAANLYKNTTASNGFKIPVRTWTIGVSTAVGPCELDYIAYQGRTDANSPKKDTGYGGYNAVDNPYIPDPTKTESTDPRLNYTIANTQYDGPAGQYYWNRDATINHNTATYGTLTAAQKFDAMIGPGKSHGHNAFFATTAQDLASALTDIVNSTGSGDYATSAPLSGAGALQSNVVTLPSTEFPKWLGHYYAYDSAVTKAAYDADNTKCYKWLSSCYNGTDPTSNSANSCIACMTWDAGYLLTEPKRAAATRKIYTWNPASTPPNALVEVVAGNLPTLQTLVPGLTAAHVDFIRGNDGAGSPRSWRLGPLINSTPALISAPLNYTQNTVSPLHGQYRIDQGTRVPVLWVGSNDGMLHGFRLADGYEQVALLPPSLLPSQITLYTNYKAPKGSVTGQLPDTTVQVYGVANSLRFSDVYFPAVGGVPASFKTVGFLASGPGAAELTAIDLTHPSPSDTGYGFGDPGNPPVQILWRKTSGSGPDKLPGLFDTWSLPALAPVSATTYRLVVGGGFNKPNTKAAQIAGGAGFVAPVYYILNPTDGSVINTQTMTSTNSPAPFVGNQAFADSVFLNTAAKFYQEDNLADLGLQADLNGRIWFASGGSSFPTSAVGMDATAKAITNQQPIYYPPAASGYGNPGDPSFKGCDVFAFASGTLYERSATVTGPNVGVSPNFEPSLYVASAPKPTTAGSPPSVSPTSILRVRINSFIAPPCPTPKLGDPPCDTDPNVGNHLSNASQVTAPPFLLVPKSGTGVSKAFFLVYDPKDGCNGFSYIIELDVTNNSSCVPSYTSTVYGGGVGAASGFTMSADQVKVAQSGIGSGATATISTIPNVTSTSGGTINLVPQWWRELK